MSKIWEKEAAGDAVYSEVSDYKQAMYQLVTQQALYESDAHQRRSYHVIARHKSAFEAVASHVGLVLHMDAAVRYVCVRPEEGLRQSALTKAETLFLIVLAKIYDDRASNGEMDTDGSVQASIEDFKIAYRDALGADYGGKIGDIKDLVRTARRFGIAKLGKDDEDLEQPFALIIQPAVSFLIPATVAGRIGADYQRFGDAEAEDAGDKAQAQEGMPA